MFLSRLEREIHPSPFPCRTLVHDALILQAHRQSWLGTELMCTTYSKPFITWNTQLTIIALDPWALHTTSSIFYHQTNATCNDNKMLRDSFLAKKYTNCEIPRVWSVKFRFTAFANSQAPTWLIWLLLRSNIDSVLFPATPSQNTEKAFSISPKSFHSIHKLHRCILLILNTITNQLIINIKYNH